MTQVLLPALAYERVADRLASLPHQIEPLLWSSDGVTKKDGQPVENPAPGAAWMSIDAFFTGEMMALAQSIVDFGSVSWVQAPLAGIDAPPFQEVIDAGIRFSNSDAPNIGVAEYVMSALLAHRHGIAKRIENQRDRRWEQAPWPEIGGQRWVIVGFGSIGHEIAQRARPFGVEIVGIRRTAVNDSAADKMATMEGLTAELAGADVVILACPLTDQTRGLVNADFLAAMQPEAVLVNVARGAVVNDQALITALDQGVIGAAILDVFDPEPLPESSPLWVHDQITVTSHLAGGGAGFLARNDQLFIDQLDNYLAGRPLRLEVMAG
ncbi:MAG: D-2-hydroxyacid dehydrogenase [Acidimicrobiales bacterium]|jgi:phosphoglycerate dehydrogenase-like enzyme